MKIKRSLFFSGLILLSLLFTISCSTPSSPDVNGNTQIENKNPSTGNETDKTKPDNGSNPDENSSDNNDSGNNKNPDNGNSPNENGSGNGDSGTEEITKISVAVSDVKFEIINTTSINLSWKKSFDAKLTGYNIELFEDEAKSKKVNVTFDQAISTTPDITSTKLSGLEGKKIYYVSITPILDKSELATKVAKETVIKAVSEKIPVAVIEMKDISSQFHAAVSWTNPDDTKLIGFDTTINLRGNWGTESKKINKPNATSVGFNVQFNNSRLYISVTPILDPSETVLKEAVSKTLTVSVP